MRGSRDRWSDVSRFRARLVRASAFPGAACSASNASVAMGPARRLVRDQVRSRLVALTPLSRLQPFE